MADSIEPISHNNFYVYEHIRLDNNTCFYVGKGKGKRSDIVSRNEHHDRISKKYGHAVVIIADNLTEEEAFNLERETIEDYVFNLGYGIDIEGYRDFSNKKYLTNCTWGGEGSSGYNFSEDIKMKISNSLKGNIVSEETKKKQSNSQKERWKNTSNERKEELRNIFSKNVKKYWDNVDKEAKKERFKHVSETRIKNETAKGKNNPMYGKHHSKETIEKLSKKVINITTGEIFNSIKDGAKKYGLIPNSISQCCSGRYKTSGGFKWIKLENYNNDFKGILIEG